jgi:hypothetical protein
MPEFSWININEVGMGTTGEEADGNFLGDERSSVNAGLKSILHHNTFENWCQNVKFRNYNTAVKLILRRFPQGK